MPSRQRAPTGGLPRADLRHAGRTSRRLPLSGSATAHLIIRAALVIIALLSVSNFNEGLIPPGIANLQQYVALVLWLLVLGASLFVRPLLRLGRGTDTMVLVAFYGFAALSVLWSDLSSASLMKGLALAITTLGAYRLATCLRFDDIIDCTLLGFFLVAAASLLMVFLVPSIGVDQTWMHAGQWQGVFESKQALGTVGGFLMFLAFHRVLVRGGWLSFGVLFVLALACVIGSESRGGAALALVACLSVYVSRRSILCTKLLAFGPLLMTIVAVGCISYLYSTGNDYIPMFGLNVDFTERGTIWQYALHHLNQRPLFGYGLNGFWSIDQIYHNFEREHGWVLDNYHDGYIAVLVETGIIGLALFALGQLLFGLKMWWLTSIEGMSRADYSAIIGFVNLVFLIDFTETFFLRSTNINSILLITCLFMSCRTPQAAIPRRANGREHEGVRQTAPFNPPFLAAKRYALRAPRPVRRIAP